MEREYGTIDRFLEGETVYVIGGGPSLADFDFKTLKDKPTVGANDAGRLSGAQTVVTIDRNYHKNRSKELAALAKKGTRVISALPADLKGYKFPPELTYLRFKRGRGLSMNPDMLYGLNSGFAALNVAYLAGAKGIHLIGFDFRFSDKGQHWHEEYSWFKQKSDRQLKRWARDFNDAVRQLNTHGVEVTNFVGPEGSEIEAFNTKPLKDLPL